MDLENKILMQEWEDDSSFIDFDLISSLERFDDDKTSKSQLSQKEETFLKQMDEDLDYAFALSLQAQYEDDIKENNNSHLKKTSTHVASASNPLSIIDDTWELIDPHPDIHALFIEYDQKFFYGKLTGVEVKWSPRMYLCAGVCSYEGRGGLCSVRLSLPLLKLRPRKDLVETLLHEMIHAYLFVTNNNKDRDGHGPEFLSHMYRINKETGTKISVYHSFHDEVDLYRKHWWKCDGPCRKKRPFFGLVKRTMNRAPGPNDNWWAAHQTSCGGNFVKIKEPDSYKKKKPTKRKLPSESESKDPHSDIRVFFKDSSSSSGKHDNSKSTVKIVTKDISSSSRSNNDKPVVKSSNISDFKSLMSKEDNLVSISQNGMSEKKSFIPFQGSGVKLGGTSEKSVLFSKFDHLHKKIEKPSSSLRKKLKISNPTSSKVAKVSNSNDAESVKKDRLSQTSNKSPSKLIQSPIKKYFSPSKNEAGSSKSIPKEIDFINLSDSFDKSVTSKVSCPVCSVLVKEDEINSHLDKCLIKK